jgi:hypothetical protein
MCGEVWNHVMTRRCAELFACGADLPLPALTIISARSPNHTQLSLEAPAGFKKDSKGIQKGFKKDSKETQKDSKGI